MIEYTTYTKDQLLALKDAYLTVKGKALVFPDLLRYGVCYNAQEALFGGLLAKLCAYNATTYLAVGWPPAPVNTNGRLDPYFVPNVEAYGNWQGPNLEMRLDLLDYLIAKCDTLLAEQE